MKIAPVADIKARLSAFIQECEGQGPVIITRNGKPVAVMLAVHDEEHLERLMIANSPRIQAIFEQARKRFREGKGLSQAAFWKTVQSRYKKPPDRSAARRRRPAKG